MSGAVPAVSEVTRVWHRVAMRKLEVRDVVDVTPRTRRVSLGGAELGAFSRGGWDLAAFASPCFDDHVKLFFPRPGEAPVLPTQDDGHLDWPESGPRPLHRDYTVRHWDDERLDLDVVRHPGGVASGWAEAVRAGDRIHVAGPRTSHVLPTASHYLLVGDETALPAIARWADETADGSSVQAVVEVADAAEEQPLGPLAARWVHRDTGGDLESAVRSLPALPADTVAWVAGEAGVVRALRRHLRDDRGVAPTRMSATGYWRRGITNDTPIPDVNAEDAA